MKKAKTEKVDKESSKEVENPAGQDLLKIKEGKQHAVSHLKERHPQTKLKDENYKAQDEFAGNPQPNRKSST